MWLADQLTYQWTMDTRRWSVAWSWSTLETLPPFGAPVV
jgi:hypothetical protein